MFSSQRGDLKLRRQIKRRPDGIVGLEQHFRGTALRTLVTHDYAIVSVIHVRRGQLSFPLTSGEIRAPSHLVLVVPKRSVLPMRFTDAEVDSSGIADKAVEGNSPAARFIATHAEHDHVAAGAGAALIADRSAFALDPDAGVLAYIRRARMLLHENLGLWSPVARLAQEVGVCPETLNRGFQRAYHLGPKTYFDKARLFSSLLLILEGRNIMEAAFSSGFGDLKRFYHQFGEKIGATPGSYARIGNRQDRATSRL
jgi:AraC-like DNA-binding protein